jgi:SpoVK/Ycf46/Vps4 family AAA+-type ATPase
METKLTFIKGALLKKMASSTAVLWVAEDLFASISKEEQDLEFVKLQCFEPLKELIVFLKLEKIPHNDFKGIYLNPEFLPQTHCLDEKTKVTISLLDKKKTQVADAITITLVNKELVSWSEDEIEFAVNQFKTQNRVVYAGQKIKIHAGTKKSVFGIVTKTYPEIKSNEKLAFKIEEQTSINLEGLPQNKQKTIDFNAIGGLQDIISQVRELILIPIIYPELYAKFKIQPPKGLLLYGPPGNGKTMIARAIAHSLGSKFISIEGPELSSKYTGEAEQRLRNKFEQAAQYENSVVFIDEIDSLASTRNKDNASEFQIAMVATLLNLMDGLGTAKGIFVIGATNRLNAIDPALRRPGRFELEFEIPLPNPIARLDILRKSFPLHNNEIVEKEVSESFLEHITQITNGYSGADLVSLYRLSVMAAISRKITMDQDTSTFNPVVSNQSIKLSKKDVLATIKKITPTTLRGTDFHGTKISWEELIGATSYKLYLSQLHKKIELLDKVTLFNRPNFMNLIVLGVNGSGKRTLMLSFADQFNYEWLRFDLTHYFSHSFEKVVTDLEDTIQRCCQVAPCVLYIENLQHFIYKQTFVLKLKTMLQQLQAQYKVLVVIAVEMQQELNEIHCKGYQGFNETVLFEPLPFSEVEQDLMEKYYKKASFFEKWNNKNLPLGELILQIEQTLIEGYED